MLAEEKYKSPYSLYQMNLISTTEIEPYRSTCFKPIMRINKQQIRNLTQALHGSYVGMLITY